MTGPAPRSQLKLLIIEDHTLFAESLELALNLEGYDVQRFPIPEEGGAQAVLASVVRMRPRIVLLDLDLGGVGDGVRLITPMVKAGVNVVVVTASNDRARWGECLRHGARKVLSKSQPLNEILSTVRRINQGLPVIDREEREALISHWHEQGLERVALQRRLALLTPREEAVLGELMQGRTVRDIASSSFVSEATVRTQVKAILSKLEVSSQLAAVGIANTAGWQPPRR
ncbi:response regulator [Nocardioides sp. LMS-CY]|uniref:DNA-binding NarL/FixJ family response regulator n=1 Tax=Nocardioides soli TaxID=1036020 RepID=A0A7W4Z1U8_9ACTN|nr:response regulator transcription factor [Nocardioides sp. LMS-CY]MBB3041960.1 DNA-binding NarL/FixJ family response regulator [Nocardioides soli]QWF21460.1 response regulator [Nocardioides sp. LMS-CY]